MKKVHIQQAKRGYLMTRCGRTLSTKAHPITHVITMRGLRAHSNVYAVVRSLASRVRKRLRCGTCFRSAV